MVETITSSAITSRLVNVISHLFDEIQAPDGPIA